MKKFLLILFLTPVVLLAARHLNTVPHREWNGPRMRIRTVESLLGSAYRLYSYSGADYDYKYPIDSGLSSKYFEDLLPRYAR
jgi:hypothetical protein